MAQAVPSSVIMRDKHRVHAQFDKQLRTSMRESTAMLDAYLLSMDYAQVRMLQLAPQNSILRRCTHTVALSISSIHIQREQTPAKTPHLIT